jgi:hypothetical protein
MMAMQAQKQNQSFSRGNDAVTLKRVKDLFARESASLARPRPRHINRMIVEVRKLPGFECDPDKIFDQVSKIAEQFESRQHELIEILSPLVTHLVRTVEIPADHDPMSVREYQATIREYIVDNVRELYQPCWISGMLGRKRLEFAFEHANQIADSIQDRRRRRKEKNHVSEPEGAIEQRMCGEARGSWSTILENDNQFLFSMCHYHFVHLLAGATRNRSDTLRSANIRCLLVDYVLTHSDLAEGMIAGQSASALARSFRLMNRTTNQRANLIREFRKHDAQLSAGTLESEFTPHERALLQRPWRGLQACLGSVLDGHLAHVQALRLPHPPLRQLCLMRTYLLRHAPHRDSLEHLAIVRAFSRALPPVTAEALRTQRQTGRLLPLHHLGEGGEP